MAPNELEQSDSAVLNLAQPPQLLSASPSLGKALTGMKPLQDLHEAKKPAVLEEVLVEEISIDGMCGVY